MFLSIVFGYCISRFIRKRFIASVIAILIGSLVGVLGALGIFAAAYPFYLAIPSGWVGIPEVTRLVIFFLTPQIEIYRFSVWMDTSPLQNFISTSIFITSSLAGICLGYFIQWSLHWKFHTAEKLE
jgi:hypothetical protein